MQLQKINNEKVKPINIKTIPQKNILGYNFFQELYSNLYICSKKKSGKTILIANILYKCADKNTIIIIFSSTVHKDDVWIECIKKLEKKKILVESYTSIYDGKNNILKDLVEQLQNENVEKDKEDIDPKMKMIFGDSDDEEKNEKKSKKTKQISPEYIIVFDDLANELKSKELSFLLKRNRHFKMKIIISSQYFYDLCKDGRLQIDYAIIFGKLPFDKIQALHKELDLSIDLSQLIKMYENATQEKYNFLYIDVRNDTYRKNFNFEYLLPKE